MDLPIRKNYKVFPFRIYSLWSDWNSYKYLQCTLYQSSLSHPSLQVFKQLRPEAQVPYESHSPPHFSFLPLSKVIYIMYHGRGVKYGSKLVHLVVKCPLVQTISETLLKYPKL